MKKKIITLAFVLALAKPMMAAQVKTELNTLINDFTLPTFAFCMLVGIIGGFLKNWKLISDSNDQGSRKEGFINVGYIAGYAFIVAAILNYIMGKVTAISITI